MTGGGGGLEIRGVSKTYDHGGTRVRALDRVSLSVEPGSIVALLGNNGAGKSTLMSICAGLIAADDGSVTVHGASVMRGSGRPSRDLGLAPQEEALYPTLTVRQNLEYFGRLSGLRRGDAGSRAVEVARRLLIAEFLDRRAGTLSGGQRRRLHTGLALMHEPSVLLLDEPTVGVDVDARARILDFVRRTADDGAAILYSTHQLHEPEALGACVVVIDHGRILATGTVEELVGRHAPPAVELRFDGDVPTLPPPLAAEVEQSASLPSGGTRVVVRVPAGTTVADVLDHLDRLAMESLLGATMLPPSLERAYLRLTRQAGRAPEEEEAPVGDESEMVGG